MIHEVNNTEVTGNITNSILERNNRTLTEIAQIDSRKQEALVRLREKYQTTDTIADCGGLVTAVVLGIFIALLVFSDLLKLFTYLNGCERKNFKSNKSNRVRPISKNPERHVYRNHPADMISGRSRQGITSNWPRNGNSPSKTIKSKDYQSRLMDIFEATPVGHQRLNPVHQT